MSFPTKPAFIFRGGWSDASRKHPAARFTEKFTHNLDAGKYSDTKWYTEDLILFKADGTHFHGRDKVIPAMQEQFAPFTATRHEPIFGVVTETNDGWEMIGQVHFYANLLGSAGPGEKKVSDASGKQWDVISLTAFHFHFANIDGEILMKRVEVMSDSTPIMKAMMKRGLIGPKELGL